MGPHPLQPLTLPPPVSSRHSQGRAQVAMVLSKGTQRQGPQSMGSMTDPHRRQIPITGGIAGDAEPRVCSFCSAFCVSHDNKRQHNQSQLYSLCTSCSTWVPVSFSSRHLPSGHQHAKLVLQSGFWGPPTSQGPGQATHDCEGCEPEPQPHPACRLRFLSAAPHSKAVSSPTLTVTAGC